MSGPIYVCLTSKEALELAAHLTDLAEKVKADGSPDAYLYSKDIGPNSTIRIRVGAQ